MSETNDISRLFSRFDGHPDQYQEIGRDNLARSSEARWPLLASVARQAATMQAVRDMGHASPAIEPPEVSAPAVARLRASGDAPEPRPLAQVRHIADAGEPMTGPAGGGRGAAAAGDKPPLAQFIPPRRRMSAPTPDVVPEPVPPLQAARHPQTPFRAQIGTAGQDWRSNMASPPSPSFTSRPETVRPDTQAQPQSPLQAVFARLARAGENGVSAARPGGSEASGTRASIFERLARR